MTASQSAGREFVIGLDLGTSSAKAIALRAGGWQEAAPPVLATAASGYTLGQRSAIASPRPGWAEQEPEAVWQGAAAALRALLATLQDSAAAQPGQCLGLCLSGAMHSCFPAAADGAPLSAALTWADQRAAPIAARLRAQTDAGALYQRTGCPLQPIYHIAKIRWWVENEPEISRKAARFAALKDYVLFRLTGIWAADLSIASGTGLLDIHRCAWDDEALALAGIRSEQLSPLVSPLEVIGPLSRQAAHLLGLPADSGIKVIAGAADGGLANLGAGAAHAGQSVITVGTSGAVRRIAPQPYLDAMPETAAEPGQRTWCYLLTEGRWYAGGAINNAGLALQRIRELFYPDLPPAAGYQQLFADAGEAAAGAEGVVILPFFAGERNPYWKADAKASFHGLGLEHDRRHVARAILEAVAFRLATIWQALQPEGAPAEAEPIRLTGAILKSPLWAQMLCDVLGTPLMAIECGSDQQAGDASAIGAAMLGQAALGAPPADALPGLAPAALLDEFAARIRPGTLWRPDPERQALYRQLVANFKMKYHQAYDRQP